MPLDRLSASWREQYVREATANERTGDVNDCVFCELLADGVSNSTGILEVTSFAFTVLNAYPYGSGHVLVLPVRHIASLEELSD